MLPKTSSPKGFLSQQIFPPFPSPRAHPSPCAIILSFKTPCYCSQPMIKKRNCSVWWLSSKNIHPHASAGNGLRIARPVIWLLLMTLPRSDGRQHDLFTVKLHQSESLEQEICNQRPSSKHRAGDICRCPSAPFPALPRDVMGFVVHHFAVHIGQDSGWGREGEGKGG